MINFLHPKTVFLITLISLVSTSGILPMDQDSKAEPSSFDDSHFYVTKCVKACADE